MRLESPKFWQRNTVLSRILWPASCLYLIGYRLKTLWTKSYQSTLPVICIGGVVAGGSGKTPVVHALLKLIRTHELFVNPVVLTRGYGGILKGPSLVDPAIHTADDVGDEALLHARHAPTIVSRNRAHGARLAEMMGADIIIMDDGLQNASLEKTLSLLVMDSHYAFGNGRLIPAGPLREPLEEALSKCAAIIQTNGRHPLKTDKPVLHSYLRITSEHDKTKNYYGFAGLGYPEKFKKTLEESGFKLSGFKAFPDHAPYSQKNVEGLILEAGTATLITTEKDLVRIPNAFQSKIEILKIELSFDKPNVLLDILKQ